MKIIEIVEPKLGNIEEEYRQHHLNKDVERVFLINLSFG
jgi:hypothetical protein